MMMPRHLYSIVPILSVLAAVSSAQVVVDDFEYALDSDLLQAWSPDVITTVSVSTNVSEYASGSYCMLAEFDFPSQPWATAVITGPLLDPPVSIGTDQYVAFRLRGDPAFAAATLRDLYLYVYDVNGDFVRFSTRTPLTEDWHVVNLSGGNWQVPWNGSGNIDMTQIERFALFQFGSTAEPIDPFTATIHVDAMVIVDEPITDPVPPSPPRSLVDDFEAYTDDLFLRDSYTYVNSWHPSTTLASLASPAPQGEQALRLDIDFANGGYPWGSVLSAPQEPFSMPDDAVISFRLKGDPSLEPVLDADSGFWLSFYDSSGSAMHYITDPEALLSPDWTRFEVRVEDFGGASTVSIGQLVQWRILVQAWGATTQPAMSASFYIDDIRISIPPTITDLHREDMDWVLEWEAVESMKYTVQMAGTMGADDWTDLDPLVELPGVEGTMSATTPVGTDAQGAIRVMALPPPPPPPPARLFFDDMELGATGWTKGVTQGATLEWELGVPSSVGPQTAYSTNNCWGTDLDGNFQSLEVVYLRTPVIDLSEATSAVLRFAQFRDMEESIPRYEWDYGTVNILDATGASLESAVYRTDGSSGTWENVSVSLPEGVLGQEVIVEFVFRSDEFATDQAGWYIDDVRVTE